MIKNRAELATTRMREHALDIVEAGIARVLPTEVMRASLKYDAGTRSLAVQGKAFDLSRARLFVVGGGKASALMAQALEEIPGHDVITAGVVTTKEGVSTHVTETIVVLPAGHPVPDERGVAAVRRMLELKSRYSIGRNDIVLCLISGGGSALMPCPVDEMRLAEKQSVTSLLLASGADISEINTVRKHLSKTKGGGLGRFFAPATVISLILSDVIGNDLSVIASGPTHPDPSTFSDALEVLRKYDLIARTPAAVLGFLEKGAAGDVEETPKTLENCHNFIIGDNMLALEAMEKEARKLGLRPHIITSEQKGEPAEVAASRAKEILNGKYAGFDVLLIGGETTPRLPAGAGKGGRNQHYAAVSVLAMKDYPGRWAVASVGTDGSDFLPDVAGAIVDDATLSRLASRSIDVQSYLDRYDAYDLLVETGDSLVKTGNTGTNVGDVIVYVLG
ncbi:MAG: hypothetical protein A2147_00520 [Chloroflexi bacterium RBG_16_57_8]|nr:MAG: hypothetical protein A2147_00520 [Chloroflexi bacterium RBG_16_57_8]